MERKLITKQIPSASNNYTWYNLYSDGYVEQSGVASGPTGTLTLPVEMATDTYPIVANVKHTTTSQNKVVYALQPREQTSTSITFAWIYSTPTEGGTTSGEFYWQVNGYAAESEYIDKIVRREFIAY